MAAASGVPAVGTWLPAQTATFARERPSVLRQGLLLIALFALYRVGRTLIDGHVHEAMVNGRSVWEFERALLLPDEVAVQQWALQWPGMIKAANWYYVGVHFPLTALFLGWTWWRGAAEYLWTRRLIIMLTAMSFVIHVLMPLTPPRLMDELGFVDTMAVIGPSAYEGSTAKVANEFAAMPSLHVAWALLVAVVAIKTVRSRWRWLALIHATLTAAVVVVTANHYWIDGVAAAGLLALTLAVFPAPLFAQAETAITSTSGPDGLGAPPSRSIVIPIFSPGSTPEMKCCTTPPLPCARTPAERADLSPPSPMTQSW